MAEYFGWAVFTGDGFISGVIPEFNRLAVAALVSDKKANGSASS